VLRAGRLLLRLEVLKQNKAWRALFALTEVKGREDCAKLVVASVDYTMSVRSPVWPSPEGVHGKGGVFLASGGDVR